MRARSRASAAHPALDAGQRDGALKSIETSARSGFDAREYHHPGAETMQYRAPRLAVSITLFAADCCAYLEETEKESTCY